MISQQGLSMYLTLFLSSVSSWKVTISVEFWRSQTEKKLFLAVWDLLWELILLLFSINSIFEDPLFFFMILETYGVANVISVLVSISVDCKWVKFYVTLIFDCLIFDHFIFQSWFPFMYSRDDGVSAISDNFTFNSV